MRNAGRGRSRIPGEALEVRYRRAGPQAGKYFHPFEPGVRMYANADGSVTFRGRKRIHADDRESGFWQRYGHGRERNPRTMAKKIGGIDVKWLMLGAVAFFIFNSRGVTAADLGIGGQQPIEFWVDGAGTVWRTLPTAALPSGLTRPASEYEIAQQGIIEDWPYQVVAS